MHGQYQEDSHLKWLGWFKESFLRKPIVFYISCSLYRLTACIHTILRGKGTSSNPSYFQVNRRVPGGTIPYFQTKIQKT